jgi:hypothetical protein
MRIRDLGWKKFGSEILVNILDPQHWLQLFCKKSQRLTLVPGPDPGLNSASSRGQVFTYGCVECPVNSCTPYLFFQVYHSTGNAAKLAEYTRILQEWNFLRDTKDNEQVGEDFVTSCLFSNFLIG